MRAAVVVIDEDKVALIERRRGSLHYFLFPGGAVEDGESAAEAARREAREELGLAVLLGQQIATVEFNGKQQVYFLAERGAGTFGSGDGQEMSGEDFEGHGSYVPVWIDIDALDTFDVRPRAVADLVRVSRVQGWPAVPQIVRELPLTPLDRPPL